VKRLERAASVTGAAAGTLAATLLLVSLGLVAFGTAGLGASEDRVIQVTPVARDGLVLVSFATDAAVNVEVERAIQSGLPTTFTYDVELRRASTFWFDKLMGSARIAVTVRYDNLTRRYQVSLMQDGRVAESRSTESADAVRSWVSVFHRLPLFSTRELRHQTEYYVRVRGRTSPRNTWSFWPCARPSAIGSAAFTFLP
jgi:Domain of unknown function (DUF4390)